jgi:hypothetical protein
LRYNLTPHLEYVSFSELFKWGKEENEPYSNSFDVNDFSRTPEINETFYFLCSVNDGNIVLANAIITGAPILGSSGQ